MRRNVRKLSWVLWLVIVAFIAFYIPDLIRGPSNIIARVDGEPIYIADFQQALQQLEDSTQIRKIKREVARIKTILREYHLDIRQIENNN